MPETGMAFEANYGYLLFLLARAYALGRVVAILPRDRARQRAVIGAAEEAAESSDAFPSGGTGVLAELVLLVAFQLGEYSPIFV